MKNSIKKLERNLRHVCVWPAVNSLASRMIELTDDDLLNDPELDNMRERRLAELKSQ